MLKLEDCETIFILLSLAGALAFSLPALAFVFPTGASERFSELYVLGPNRMAEDYPFNVKADETYEVYLGIANHMGSSTYYALYVKLRNQSQLLPNSTAEMPSPLPVLYEFRTVLSDGEVWEALLNFSFGSFSISGNSCFLKSLMMNGVTLYLDRTASWDSENKGYYLELFFELWIYDSTAKGFSFHNRFVGIWLNMTG
jgi:hypothetical protein